MFPLTLSLIFVLIPPPQGANPLPSGSVPTKQGASSEQSPDAPPGSKKGETTDTQPAPVDPWAALKTRIGTRLDKDRKRMEQELKPYLSDLALDARDTKNRKYLEVRYREIAALDPDIGLVLLPHLAPKGNSRRHRLIADNSMRILERTKLKPLEADLLRILDQDKGGSRNRALYLLTGFKKIGLDGTLKKLLEETPEVHLPGVIVAVGRYGQGSLAKPLEPFLQKPDEKQRKAAFDALCLIGAAESLGPLAASAKTSNKTSDKIKLIHFLEALGRRTGKSGWANNEPVFFETMTWLLTQGEALRPREIRDLLAMVQTLPAPALQAGGGEKLTEALNRLLTNPYPDVQFGAALALRHLGDKKGVKQVLNNLNRFIRNNKKLAYAYRQRGRAHEAFGNLTDAMRDYKQAITLSAGRVEPKLYFAVARLEAKKNNASNVYRYLKDARPTRQELDKFRSDVPEVEALIRRSNQLRKLFNES